MSKNTVEMVCPVCNKTFEKEVAEIRRQQKKKGLSAQFYCCLKCSSVANREKRKKPEIIKTCPVCNKQFVSTTKVRAATFCSRSCASKGSITEARREAGRKTAKKNFIHDISQIQSALIAKEGWKYQKLEKYLKSINENYAFEYPIGESYNTSRIYDLVLFDKKLIIEFDGSDHKSLRMLKDNEEKEKFANDNGFTLKRIEVSPNTIIEPDCIFEFVKKN